MINKQKRVTRYPKPNSQNQPLNDFRLWLTHDSVHTYLKKKKSICITFEDKTTSEINADSFTLCSRVSGKWTPHSNIP